MGPFCLSARTQEGHRGKEEEQGIGHQEAACGARSESGAQGTKEPVQKALQGQVTTTRFLAPARDAARRTAHGIAHSPECRRREQLGSTDKPAADAAGFSPPLARGLQDRRA